MTSFDVIVVGAGMRGLHHALRTRTERPDAALLVVDASPRPGADICTHRSNGFTCELGPFAFTGVELDHILAPLSMPPRIVARQEQAKTGWLFDGSERRPLRVEPEPLSFVSGCEDVVQSYRRELDTCLRLGRAVTRIQPDEDGGFTVTLGGEVPTDLKTREVVLAISTVDAARLLGGIEPELPHVAEQEQREPRAFVHLGGFARTAPELATGYAGLAVLESRAGNYRKSQKYIIDQLRPLLRKGREIKPADAPAGRVERHLGAADKVTGARQEPGLDKIVQPAAQGSAGGGGGETDRRGHAAGGDGDPAHCPPPVLLSTSSASDLK